MSSINECVVRFQSILIIWSVLSIQSSSLQSTLDTQNAPWNYHIGSKIRQIDAVIYAHSPQMVDFCRPQIFSMVRTYLCLSVSACLRHMKLNWTFLVIDKFKIHLWNHKNKPFRSISTEKCKLIGKSINETKPTKKARREINYCEHWRGKAIICGSSIDKTQLICSTEIKTKPKIENSNRVDVFIEKCS